MPSLTKALSRVFLRERLQRQDPATGAPQDSAAPNACAFKIGTAVGHQESTRLLEGGNSSSSQPQDEGDPRSLSSLETATLPHLPTLNAIAISPLLIEPPILQPHPPPDVETDETLQHLTGLGQRVEAAFHTPSKGVKMLNKIEDGIDTIMAQDAQSSNITQAIKPLFSDSHHIQAMETGVDTFMENIPWLMKALDDVAKIHPVVAVAVLAFKAVYSMEKTRRENDKRIKALYVEMKDMILVLVPLRGVAQGKKDDSARLELVSGRIAEDIKDCANVCETYSKKRLLVKVLKGAVWEGNLVGFAKTFAQRRADLEEALVIYNALALHAVKSTVESIERKLDLFTKLFEKFTPPEERDLAKKIDEQGGARIVQNDDALLRELNKSDISTDRQQPERSKRQVFTLKDLKEELREDYQTSVAKNLETFEVKFTLHQRQLKEELAIVMRDENNLLLENLHQGPHDKITNEELKDIWREMGWRRNVEARLFVMTLRDHFKDKAQDISRADNALRTDDWALEYIGIPWLQPIMEAFDDDGSGYITIAEVNRFSQSLPSVLNWSLQHWLAYWTIGWQFMAEKYRAKIQKVLDTMFSMLPLILPDNRYWADHYLGQVWADVVRLTSALKTENVPPEYVQSKFQGFFDLEEERIRKNLEESHYDIDALDAVHVVAGPGRIEQYIFLLIYLLLERDLERLRIAQVKVLSDEELRDAADSLVWVFDAIRFRVSDLQELFKQQKTDVAQQFKMFASQIYYYYHDNSEFWSNLTRGRSVSEFYISSEELAPPDPNSIPDQFLNYPLNQQYPYETSVYDRIISSGSSTPAVISTDDTLLLLLGEWNGYVYEDDEYPLLSMTSFYFQASGSSGGHNFTASGYDFDNTGYTVTGLFGGDDGITAVNFSLEFSDGSDTEYFSGKLNDEGSIMGTRGFNKDVSEHRQRFILRKIPAELMCCRPSPLEFADNKPRALWRFACVAVRKQCRKRLWTWSYFRERRDIRLEYIRLNISYWTYGRSLTSTELQDFLRCRQTLTALDASFHRSIRNYRLSILPNHLGWSCDSCRNPIGGGRIVCLDCVSNDSALWRTVDFCDDPVCYNAGVVPGTRLDLKTPHLPFHRLFKVRSVLHERDLQAAMLNAKEAHRLSCLRFEELDESRKEENHDGVADVSSGNGDRGCPVNGPMSKTAPVLASPSSDGEDQPEDPNAQDNLANGCHKAEDSVKSGRDSPGDEATLAPAPIPISTCAGWQPGGLNASNGPHNSGSQTNDIKCTVCQKAVEQLCWYCAECWHYGIDYFLCDDCDSKFLLRCELCREPYVQPRWYYKTGPDDRFSCNKCTARGLPAPNIDKETQHTNTHPLVRCSQRINELPVTTEPSTSEKLVAVEEKINAIAQKLDTSEEFRRSEHERSSRLEEKLVKIERLLGSLLAAKSSA